MRILYILFFLFLCATPVVLQSQPVDSKWANLHSQLVLRAEAIRKNIIERPDSAFGKLENTINPPLLAAIKEDGYLVFFLEPSLPFIGCAGGGEIVVGFYNVVQNVWMFLSVDESNRILDARLSLGLEPKDEAENVAWFDYVAKNRTIEWSLQKSAEVQLRAFISIFPYSNCPSLSAVQNLLDGDAAAATIAGEALRKFDIDEYQLIDIQAKTATKGNAKSVDDIILAGVWRHIPGYDLLTMHVARRKRSVMLVQGWVDKDGNLSVGGQDVVDLLVKE